ncbi:AraC family transcriptional regulator [Vibrio mangrovi]|uniref:AraC family transcriptional regulator n=1 Tax=Vibrio mangrovi TaxID=474394 RepID=A0A1Y6IQN6_9VIBR|nr:AraC family transcriptional regulator [Vibrio mangrovi]MDW6003258.1 AraC family transcriptional regulator [Vibrio mangrovi]SMR99954.1 Exoenzyme S synthesis regulatory protein ExsA [Vibrio mangrovi]
MSATQDTMSAGFEQLREQLLQRMPEPGNYPTPVSSVMLCRRNKSHQPENCFNKPILAMTVQGSKRTVVGNEVHHYTVGQALLAGIDMPSMSYQLDATPEHPYLVISLELDMHLISLLSAQLPKSTPTQIGKGAVIIDVEPELRHSFSRLVDLFDKPEQVPVLAPVILQEIYLQLLLGPHGNFLKSINTQGTHGHQISQAIHWLRSNFHQPLNVDELAAMTHMASSTFRKHFKGVTTMSPTEYHKHLRLYEAQRLMLEDHQDASTAGYSVGYESPTQFNREYKRLFGEPPQRNISRLMSV